MKNKPIPSPTQNPTGLHQRYIISKTDGSPVDPDAEYFVLRLDDGGKDRVHVEACRHALMTYAADIQAHLPQLAHDIRARYSEMRRPGFPKRTVQPIKPPATSREVLGKAVIDSAIDEPKPEV